jgi:hypothetical protein
MVGMFGRKTLEEDFVNANGNAPPG